MYKSIFMNYYYKYHKIPIIIERPKDMYYQEKARRTSIITRNSHGILLVNYAETIIQHIKKGVI